MLGGVTINQQSSKLGHIFQEWAQLEIIGPKMDGSPMTTFVGTGKTLHCALENSRALALFECEN